MTFAEIAAALPSSAVTTIDLPFPRIASGKVREIFDLGDALLLVASDRLSAFDVILPDGIPGKGIILTQMSNWWFSQTSHLIPNHLLPNQADLLANKYQLSRDLQLRSMVVRKLQPLTIECVARGYLIGSGWSAYQKTGSVCGIRLPAGLRQADRLPEPIFTPTTKAPKGQHDEPIDDAQGAAAIGAALYEKVKSTSLALYQFGHDRARQAGMILADTKFEFGTDAQGNLFLHRRGPHARLLALLARRPLRARHVAAELRQTIRPRSPARDRLGPETARAAPARRRHHPHAGKIPRRPPKPPRLTPLPLHRRHIVPS